MALVEDPSAWRNFRKPRVPTRLVGRPRKHPSLSMFYGYPAELIADWCCVALSTAFAYKSGRLKPSKPVARLFRLHRDRLILPDEWRGWLVKPDAIVDPEGNETNRSALRNYQLMLAYFRNLAERSADPHEMAKWCQFVRVA